ncbi:CoA transferase [Exilibacterium tricleocarpae]|uniref:CoA transferase n=1 Tax=Exilibacterium tricleocarpae TaxID=2591008 RepID=A0A545SSR8_9GAMM|nr:CaiB/BaiF CoA-transferase family protein [Exilibacterium tricleocarpae]TQV68014.1 CoA transferase [Exilibacterium tricleocarpae]
MNSSKVVRKPYDGLLVVSIEQALAAPLCSCRLADAGARVIKIERSSGDFARGYDKAAKGDSSYFVWTNRGKESVVLDIKSDTTLLNNMLQKADVFIQNLAPGAAKRAGLCSTALRERFPQLVTCDITGYGEGSPYEGRKAYDLLVQSESGLISTSSFPCNPARIGVSICDIAAGLNALIGIQQALQLRSQTGQGSSVKVSLFDSVADWMNVPILHEKYAHGGWPTNMGLMHPSIAPYGGFKTADEETIVISVQNEREWKRFCGIVLSKAKLASDTKFSSNYLRVQNRQELDTEIQAAFSCHSKLEMEKLLTEADIAFGSVNSAKDLVNHPLIRYWPVKTSCGDEVEIIASPVRTEQDTGRFNRVPKLGEHTEKLRQEFM